MEPLFENHLTVDEAVLLEWYKKEFYADNPFFVVMHVGLIAVYLLLAALVAAGRWLLPAWLAAVAIALFLLLAVGFSLNLLLRYRVQVRQLLKSEEGARFPARFGMVFYAGFAMPAGEAPGQNPAGEMLACVDRAAALQREFAEVMGRIGQDAEGVEQMRPRLARLKEQMEDISAQAKALSGRQHSYDTLSGYAQTANLHILQFEDAAVLAKKDGFTLGTNEDFGAFVAEKLRAAAGAARDEKRRKRLEKALAKYFPAQP